ncbi:Cilia- and flagella-associated protein 299 [Dissostichus eleginoides]|uniref:Cilia- and flagella-associated protein 299 n=1 Tax=Dissostichus eleginoides TaxID=100907 RepID=A0AAD9BZM5_DISEL|nr:Cilia- and flagella-associated protein 299 [Dissostichus eleginoides]
MYTVVSDGPGFFLKRSPPIINSVAADTARHLHSSLTLQDCSQGLGGLVWAEVGWRKEGGGGQQTGSQVGLIHARSKQHKSETKTVLRFSRQKEKLILSCEGRQNNLFTPECVLCLEFFPSIVITCYLNYYNWKTQVSTSNSSPNFEVIYDDPNGLLFKNKRDKKILNVDPMSGPGEDSNRTFLQSDLYIHVVIYDHNIRTV